ncbi:MAG: hypothetical protein ACE5J2_00620 [Nitrososphaerales archaeon]
MPICDVCGKFVRNLKKHKARRRCGARKKSHFAPIERREPWLR